MNSRNRLRGSGMDFSLDGIALPTFQRNSEQRLMVGLYANSLEIIEVIMGCRGRNYSNDRHSVPAEYSHRSIPRARIRIVVNWLESLGPVFPFYFVGHNQPNLMHLREVLQRSGNRVGLHAPADFGWSEKAICLWLGDPDLLAKPSPVTATQGRVDDRCDETCRNSQDDRKRQCHSLSAYLLLRFFFRCWLPVPGRDAAPSPQIRSTRFPRFACAAGSMRTHVAAPHRRALRHSPTTSSDPAGPTTSYR
jgi:hypothetical protein